MTYLWQIIKKNKLFLSFPDDWKLKTKRNKDKDYNIKYSVL